MASQLVFTDLKWFLRIVAVMMSFIAVFILETANPEALFPIQQSVQPTPTKPDLETIQLFSLNLSVWVAFLLLVSASTYFILSTTGFGWYIRNLKHKLNFMRWLHHSVSTSLMIVITALISGISDALTLLVILLLSIAIIMFGFLMELWNEKRKRIVWSSYVVGLSVMLIGWLCLMGVVALSKYVTSTSFTSSDLWLYSITSFFMGFFSLVMLLHYQGVGPWKDYVYSEKTYILVNFVAKAVFALVLYQEYLV